MFLLCCYKNIKGPTLINVHMETFYYHEFIKLLVYKSTDAHVKLKF